MLKAITASKQTKMKDMNKIFFTKRTSILLLAISLFSSCMEKDVYQGDKNTPLNPTEVFDFSLTKEVKLNVDYGFTNDYYIIFELYNQNPMKEENNSWIKDEKLSPIYAASTDKKGSTQGKSPSPPTLRKYGFTVTIPVPFLRSS